MTQERVPTASGEKEEIPEDSEEKKGGVAVPEGWAEATDPSSGKVYYYNHETGETSWTLPDLYFPKYASSMIMSSL